MSQENLLNAVISSNIDEIVNLLKSGVEVTKDIVSEADKTPQSTDGFKEYKIVSYGRYYRNRFIYVRCGGFYI